MINYGDIKKGDSIFLYFTTSDSDGAACSWDSSPTVSVYYDSQTTELTDADTGITLTEDFDGKTGLHLVTILSAQHASFVNGKSYNVIVDGTVDGTVVRAVIGYFTIERFFPHRNETFSADDVDAGSGTMLQRLLWLCSRFMNKHTSDNVNGIRIYDNDEAEIISEQSVSESSGVKSVGQATEYE